MPFPVWRWWHKALTKNPQWPTFHSHSIIEYIISSHCSNYPRQQSEFSLESPLELFSPIVAFKLRKVVVSDWHVLNRTHTAFISCGPSTSKLRKSVEPQVQQIKNAEEIALPVFLLSAYQAACSDASAHLQTNVRKKHQQRWYAKVFCKAAILCIPEASILCLLSKETEASESSDLGRWARKV